MWILKKGNCKPSKEELLEFKKIFKYENKFPSNKVEKHQNKIKDRRVPPENGFKRYKY